MEQRLIDANVLCERLAARALEYSGLDECTENTIKEDMHIVHTMPTIEARPVVQRCRYCRKNDCGGIEWDCSDIGVTVTLQAGKFRISNEYGDYAELPINYCPNCGAQMDGGDGNGGADSED